MTKEHLSGEMLMIPVDLIDVLNPRDRNKRVFDEIVANIKTIGLKRPITVTPRTVADGADRYLLVCGLSVARAGSMPTVHWAKPRSLRWW